MSIPNPATTEWVPLWDTNGSGGPHHSNHEPGGSDVIVNNAWTNTANTFTQNQTISKTAPKVIVSDPSLATGSRTWTLGVQNDTTLGLVATDDAGGAGVVALKVERAGAMTCGTVTAGSLTTTPLNASQLTSGTVADARLSANVPLKNAVNTFTVPQRIEQSGPYLELHDTSQPADSRKFLVQNISGSCYIGAYNDAYTLNPGWLRVSRAGSVTTVGMIYPGDVNTGASQSTYYLAGNASIAGLYSNGTVYIAGNYNEKGRSTPMGHWTAFTPTFGPNGTLMVQLGNKYTLIGKTCIVTVYMDVRVDQAGNPTSLAMFLPGGITVAAGQYGGSAMGIGATTGFVQSAPSASTLVMARDVNFTGTFVTGTTYRMAFTHSFDAA